MTKKEEIKAEKQFQKGLKLMREVMKIQDYLFKIDELFGEKFNEAINNENLLRERPY